MTAADSNCTQFLDLYGAGYKNAPHDALRACRQQSWCASTVFGPAILRYAEVAAVLGDRRFRTPGADILALQGITDGPLVEAMSGLLVMSDGEPHGRVRRVVSKGFTVRRVEALRPTVRQFADDLAADLGQRLEA